MKTFMIPRCFTFEGYETYDIQVSTRDKTVKIYLKPNSTKAMFCHLCKNYMSKRVGCKQRKIKDLEIRGFATTVHFPRRIGRCETCDKARVEEVDFISELSPHFTKDYAWWLGEICEFATIKRSAKFCKVGNMSLRRIDFRRMRKMLQSYKIPDPTRISVDEVYAYKFNKHLRSQPRTKKFFTVICDLDTRKVIWVATSRDKGALDEFYQIVGEKVCQGITAVAMDQHADYRLSTEEHCPNATVVWDRFHLMRNFDEAVNLTRQDLHANLPKNDDLVKLTRGKYKSLFLKKACRRTEKEKSHIDDVLLDHHEFAQLEIIKEGMIAFFDQADEDAAKAVFKEMGDWIWQKGFKHLMSWYSNMEKQWDTLKNYFSCRVTTSLSEGVNNVIKSLKRQAFGFRNMEYFKLKIMQRCGYLNSEYMSVN